MRALFLTLVLTFQLVGASAQLTSPDFRIILYSGEIVNGNHLRYESPLLKPATFLIDDMEYSSFEVGFFQNSHGYFANLAKLHGENTERYAMRIKKGKLNLYEEIEISVYGGENLLTDDETGNQLQDPMLATGESFNYYSMGNEPVREANYSNLTVDLKDNAESLSHLKKYRNYRLLQWTMLSLGSGVVAYEVIRSSGSSVRLSPFMAFGIVIGGGSYFMEAPKQDELWLAADAYNAELPITENANP